MNMPEPESQKRDQLIHVVPSGHWGGVEQYALDICRHYHALGWDVTAITRDAQAVDSHFLEYGIPLRHALFGGYTDMGSIYMMARYLQALRRGRAIVHVHRYCDAFTVLTAKRLAKRPDVLVVVTRHCVAPGHNTWLFRRMCRKIDANIFVSQTVLDTFVSPWKHGRSPLPPERVHLLRNSLNLDGYTSAPPPSHGPVIALCHGTIVRGKGFETVVDALSTLTDIKLRLRIAGVGNPDYIDELRSRAMTRGVMDRIDWTIPAPDMRELIADCHFGVQASVQREAFGFESLRYMACGRPQVCVANGAQSEYLRDGFSAIFAPPADSAKLAEAMRRLATDPALRDSLGSNALADFSRYFHWDRFISALDSIYNPS